MNYKSHFLRELGVYGFDRLEVVILASLVSGDPLLLIGKAGTGKTFLLNSISEALGLQHRHYNASFISFDDLIGFPFPDAETKEVNFLKSPATIWDAESVLIDEISRCKPEIQNKFFSIIQERKIQGIPLDKLQYRWAAMNPLLSDIGDSDDHYEGSIALDQALADRFAFIIEVPDWEELSREEQELVIYPSGEGVVNSLSRKLTQFIAELKLEFLDEMVDPENDIIDYCRLITSHLTEAGYRISPRRARLLSRNLISMLLVAEKLDYPQDDKSRSKLFKWCTTWSIPQRAWKGHIPAHIIDLAHSEAMQQLSEQEPQRRWMQEFLRALSLNTKVDMIIDDPIPKEVKSLALIQFLNNGSVMETGAFAFATQPLFENIDLVDDEALAELTKKTNSVLHLQGEIKWRTYSSDKDSVHPQWTECVSYISNLPKDGQLRRKRAHQFFLYLLTNDAFNYEPEFVETRLNALFRHLSEKVSSQLAVQKD